MKIVAWPKSSGNPYNPLLYAAMADAGAVVEEFNINTVADHAPDVVHVHWPEAYQWHDTGILQQARRANWTLQALRAAKAGGARVVWTCHNPEPHDLRGLDRLTWGVYERRFLRMVDGIVFMTETSRRVMFDRMPALVAKPSVVVPHGHYRAWYGPAIDRREARARLGLPEDAFVFLMFGRLRPYKNAHVVIDAFSALTDDSLRLVVAGEPADQTVRADLETRSGSRPDIRLRLDMIPDEDVPALFSAADCVVLPYPVFNSGVALLAASYGRPFLTPRTGCVTELLGLLGPGGGQAYEGGLTPEVLARARAEVTADRAAGLTPDLTPFEWTPLAGRTLSFMRELCTERHAGAARPATVRA